MPNCEHCRDTGLVGAEFCVCRAGRRLKIKKLNPWIRDDALVDQFLKSEDLNEALRQIKQSLPEDLEKLEMTDGSGAHGQEGEWKAQKVRRRKRQGDIEL